MTDSLLNEKNQNSYQYLANLIEFLHIIIAIVSIAAMFLIFLYKPLKTYSAIWLCCIWIVGQIYGCCPLTVKEYELRQKAGEKVDLKKFIPRFFEKYFNLNIPDWMAKFWLTFYFLVAVFVILDILFNKLGYLY